MAKQKQKMGSTAIPFLLTILISLIIIGGAALYIFNKVDNNGKSSTPDSVETNEYYTPTAEDSKTLMLIFDTEDSNSPVTFMVLRIDPEMKKYVCIPLASTSIIDYDGQILSLEEHYNNGGVIETKNSLESLLCVPIDRYMKMNGEGFQKICDILGGVQIYVPSDVDDMESGEQYLAAAQIQKLVTYGEYKNGEQQRMIMVGTIVSSMLNQVSGERVAAGLDNSFTAVINLVDSDISVIDYSESSVALKYLLKQGNDPAEFRNPIGTELENGYFELDKSIKEDVEYWFNRE